MSKRSLLAAAACLSLLAGSPAFCLPVGGVVTAQTTPGNTTFNQTANTLTVNQTSQRTFLDWTSFNIANGETVTFNQPNANAIAFNRIASLAPTDISGLLSANGGIWLYTPGGLIVGSSARILVGTLAVNLAPSAAGTEQDDLNNNGSFHAGPQAVPNASIIINPGAQVAANVGFAAFLGAHIVQNGNVSATDSILYVLSDGGGFFFVPQPSNGGLSLTATGLAPSPSVRIGMTQTGQDHARGFYEIITAQHSNLEAGYNAVINLSGVVSADRLETPQAPSGFEIWVPSFGAAQSGHVTVDTSQARITTGAGAYIAGDTVIAGQETGTRLYYVGTDGVTLTGAINASNFLTATSTGGDISIDGALSAGADLTISTPGNIRLAGTIRVVPAVASGRYNISGTGTMTAAAGKSLSVAANADIHSDGYMDLSSGGYVFRSSDNGESFNGTGDLSIGQGASLQGGMGLGLEAAGLISIAGGARVTSLSDDNVIASQWPFVTSVRDLDGGLSLEARDLDIQGDLYSYAHDGVGRGAISLGAAPGAVAQTLGGAGADAGFTVSNAEFQHFHASSVFWARPLGDTGLDLTVRDLTLDSGNLDALWLGQSADRSILVTGTVQGAGASRVDLRLGLVHALSVTEGSGLSPLADLEIPGKVVITGALGTRDHPLGHVGLISGGDLVMGSNTYAAAATDPGFDPATAAPYDGEPGHLFVSAGGLQMAAAGRILQQNTGTRARGAGLMIGAPTADNPLIIAPDILAFLTGAKIDVTGLAAPSYGSGPSLVDIYGSVGGGAGAARGTAPSSALLASALSTKDLYKLNGCAFGVDSCGLAPPTFQAALVTMPAAVIENGPSSPGGGGSGSGDLVLGLTIATPTMADEDEKKQGVSQPTTGSGNQDLWIPLESVQ